MNRAIINKLVRKAPASLESSYIFVNDNRAICEAVITVGFTSLYVSRESSSFFTLETLCDFIRDTVNTGSEIENYTFVLACFRKRTNDSLEAVLKNNLLQYKSGAYTLFKDKEYLAKYDRQGELEEALRAYVRRFEGSDEILVDKGQFCRYSDSGAVQGIIDIAIVRYLMETYCMFVSGKELYIYQNGCYVLDRDGVRIKQVISGLIPDRYITYRNLSSVYSLLLEQQPLQKTMEELNCYPAWWINFRNGMFDVKAGKLHRHRPEYYSINQIPHELDMKVRENMEAAGTATRKFLSAALPDPEDQVMLWEYIGYCMTRDTGFQKFLILRGDGGTGKSKVIHMVEEIVGADNCSGVSLQDLNERFFPSMLYGKLVNACADISSEAMMQVDNIKKATGEDIMICEKKNKDPTPFRSYAKLLFSANKIPLNLDEKSNAFYRRLLILSMEHKPSEEEKDLELSDKLHAELGYSVWMAVGALKKLYKDGKFVESAGCRSQVEDLYRAADTVKAFADECLEPAPGKRMARTMIYDSYKEYCDSYGRKPHSPMIFYRSLAEKGYAEGRGKDGRFFKDIALRDDGFVSVD